jgi:preprotein translocase subunit YajC
MFIATAYAQTAGAPGMGLEQFYSVAPLLLIFVVFYFLLIRPQQQKVKKHKELIAGVRRGDRVVTGGGIHGVVTKVVSNDEVIVEIAEGVRVKVVKSTLAEVPSRTGPAPAATGSRVETAGKDAEEEETEQESAESGKR